MTNIPLPHCSALDCTRSDVVFVCVSLSPNKLMLNVSTTSSQEINNNNRMPDKIVLQARTAATGSNVEQFQLND